MAPAKGPPVATCQLWGLITWAEAGSGTFFLGPHPQMLTSSRWAVCYLLTVKTSLEPTGPGRCVRRGHSDSTTKQQSLGREEFALGLIWETMGSPVVSSVWTPAQEAAATGLLRGQFVITNPGMEWGWSPPLHSHCLRVWICTANLKKNSQTWLVKLQFYLPRRVKWPFIYCLLPLPLPASPTWPVTPFTVTFTGRHLSEWLVYSRCSISLSFPWMFPEVTRIRKKSWDEMPFLFSMCRVGRECLKRHSKEQ